LRLREGASQAVFARYLNVTTGLISQWERGEKRPQGASLKLLTLVAKNGLQAVACCKHRRCPEGGDSRSCVYSNRSANLVPQVCGWWLDVCASLGPMWINAQRPKSRRPWESRSALHLLIRPDFSGRTDRGVFTASHLSSVLTEITAKNS
jgi:hypothetical protein